MRFVLYRRVSNDAISNGCQVANGFKCTNGRPLMVPGGAQVAVRTWTAYAPVQIRSISATPFALLRYSIPILIRKPLYAWDLEVGTLVMLLLCDPEC